MTDLVSHHPRQFVFGVEVRQDSARDVHESAGQRKCVDYRCVHHADRVIEIRPVRNLGNLLAYPVDVTLQSGIIVQPVFGDNLRIGFFAHLDFL